MVLQTIFCHSVNITCLKSRLLTSATSAVWLWDMAHMHELDIIWNNGFRHVFNCCWRDRIKPLQFFCQSMPLSFVIEERQLMFFVSYIVRIILYWEPMVPMVKYEILRLAVKYGLNDERDRDCLLLGILYGRVLCRKFSCNVYIVLDSFYCLCVFMCSLSVCFCVLHTVHIQ